MGSISIGHGAPCAPLCDMVTAYSYELPVKMSLPGGKSRWAPRVSNQRCRCFQSQTVASGGWTCRHICLQLPSHADWSIYLPSRAENTVSVNDYFWSLPDEIQSHYVKCIAAVGVAWCHPRTWEEVERFGQSQMEVDGCAGGEWALYWRS